MNRIFRKVWNRALGVVVVASELARGRSDGAPARRARAMPAVSVLTAALLSVGSAWAQDDAATTRADAETIAKAVEQYLQSQDDAANDRASSLLFSSDMMSAAPQSRSMQPGGSLTPMGVINPGGLAGGTLPGLVNHLQQFLVGGNYQQCGLLGNGQLLPTECLTISRANFNYAFTGAALFGTDLLTLPNVADLNGNRPADHTTVIGRATSGSYLTVTNAQYSSGVNNANCTLANLVGVCIPGVLGTYTWSTLPAQDFQIIIGDGAAANGSNTVVLGTNATHTLPAAAWAGTGAPDGNYGARLGNAVVVGHGANGTADRQVILGANASSTHVNSVALGAGAVTDRGALANYTAAGTTLVRSSVGSVSIGAVGANRQLAHVAAGTQATDAVNVEQMQGALTQVNAVNALAVGYDSAARTGITLQGAGGTTISNLAAGTVAPLSTQAINGAQLHGVSMSVAAGLGGGATVSTSGAVTAPSYSLDGGAVSAATNVGAALTNLDGRTSLNTTNIASNTTSISTNTTNIGNLLNGTAGLVQQDPATLALSVAAATGGTTVGFANTSGAARALTGVAAGAVDAASTQAVNGAQLFGANTSIAARLGGGASVAGDGSVTAPTFNVQGGAFLDVATAFAAVDGALDGAAALADSAVQYDDDGAGSPDLGRVTLAGGTGTTIGNLAAGIDDDEAVNVAQLSPVVAALGGGAAIDPVTGAVTGPTYSLDDGTGTPVAFNDVGGALDNLDGRTTGNTTNIDNLLDGTAGLVQQAGAAAALTVGAATGGVQVDFSNDAGDARRLSGVATGSDDTDAVNFAQLRQALIGVDGNLGFSVVYDDDGAGNPDLTRITLGATGAPTTIGNVAAGIADNEAVNVGQLTPVVAALGGGASMDPATGAVTGPTYTLDDGSNTAATVDYGDVGSALGNLDTRVLSNTASIEGLDAGGASRYFRVNSSGAVAQALGTDSVAIGQNAITNGDGGVAIGLDAVTGSVGDPARINQVAIGNNARATAQNSTAVGGGSLASGPQATAFGSAAQATGSNSLAVGRNASAGDIGTAIGMNAVAIGVRATSLGQGAEATAADATAIGQMAVANATNSVALGLGSLADRANAVSVGTAADLRQIINVGDATDDTDAVNLRQLTAVEDQITGLGELSVQYDDASQSRLTLGGVDGTTIGGLAAGVAADEAVNVAQLTPVIDALGGGAAVDPVTGAVTGPTYTLDDGSDTAMTQDYVDVGGALGNLDARTTSNTGNVNALLDGSGGLVRQDAASQVVTVAGQTGGTQVSFANAGGDARRLSGVADATDVADAVNLSQLGGVSGSFATHLGGGSSVNPDGTITAPAYSIGGASYGNVGAAFDAVDDVLGDAVAVGAFAVRYDDDGTGAPDLSRITLTGATGTTLANVAAGVAADEAVNVAQLTPVIDALGGGAAVDPATGAVTGPTYVLDDGSGTGTTVSVDNVGTAISNLDGRTTTNTADIEGLLAGTAGLVQQDPASLVIGVGSQVAGTQVDFANSAGDARRLSGVATGTVETDAVNVAQLRDAIVDVNSDSVFAVRYDEGANGDANYGRITLGGGADGTTLANVAGGEIASGSTEAINGGQLFATQSAMAKMMGGGASMTRLGVLEPPSYQIQGAFYDNVGEALAAVNQSLIEVNGRINGLPPSAPPVLGEGNALIDVDGPEDGSGEASAGDGTRGVAVGADAVSDGEQAVAIGGNARAGGDHATAVGGSASVQAADGTALGANATVEAGADNAVAVGEGAAARAAATTVVGQGASAAAVGGVALGQGASANAGNSVALGQGTVADRANTVSVGTAGGERQLTNVAAGTAGTDAVNVNQMDSGMERALQSANDYTDARLNQMQTDVWEIDRGYRAGVASAMAVAGLPQAYQPGRSMIAAAVSSYEQEAGMAVGITTISEDGRWVYKFSGTTNTRNDLGVTVGAGLQW